MDWKKYTFPETYQMAGFQIYNLTPLLLLPMNYSIQVIIVYQVVLLTESQKIFTAYGSQFWPISIITQPQHLFPAHASAPFHAAFHY